MISVLASWHYIKLITLHYMCTCYERCTFATTTDHSHRLLGVAQQRWPASTSRPAQLTKSVRAPAVDFSRTYSQTLIARGNFVFV